MKQRVHNRAEMLILKGRPTQRRILLITDGRGLYAFPGGGMFSGETPEETAIRKAAEEAGVVVKRVQDTGFIYRREGISSRTTRTYFFVSEFKKLQRETQGAEQHYLLEWAEPLEAIRVICHNNWRYDGEIIQPILERTLS
jgi:8-oxo-dGTP pyrophosphatase MutT (NUDIX family)